MTTPFDAGAYWKERMRSPSLTATGRGGMPLAWQRWRYRSLERALLRFLHRHRVPLSGAHVLDFGCGTGYFEDVWEREGAKRADGLDISPDAIARLSAQHPNRTYVAGDLSSEPYLLAPFGRSDLVTAIDVVYHITDDSAIRRTVGRLVASLPSGGHFLVTEGTKTAGTETHVVCRPKDWWRETLGRAGADIVATAPVFIVHDRPLPRGGRHLPPWAASMLGALQYAADRALLPWCPWGVQTYALLARKR